jgi:two-component system, LytTR family, sensor kinase
MTPLDTAFTMERPSFLRMWAWSFPIWTAVSALFNLNWYVSYAARGEKLSPYMMGETFLHWMIWAFFTPFVLCYVWQRPVTRANWRENLSWQVAGAILIPALMVVPLQTGRYLLDQAFPGHEIFKPVTGAVFVRTAVNALTAHIDLMLLGHAVFYARYLRNQAVRRAQLETRLAEAQLQVLRLQLHPHFLFNTLHTISALMHKDLRAADRMLALLGDLLRDSFEKVGAQEVSLKQELGFLERYLEIERTRFRDRLTIHLNVDPETLDAEIPNLLLQPLVENAIRHGIGKRQDAGRIDIIARRKSDRLDVRIRDDGPGLTEAPEVALRGGVGLANTAERLQQLYPNAHLFDLHNRPEGGLEVALEIPFKVHREPPPSSTTASATARMAGSVAPSTPEVAPSR